MFEITSIFEIIRDREGRPRLVARDILGINDFNAIAEKLGETPFTARKATLIAARKCRSEEYVETRWNGRETTNRAQLGDYIATSLDRAGMALRDSEGNTNVYVIGMHQFANLYRADAAYSSVGITYRARATVCAIFIAGGFDLKAPWGETQQADRGYVLANGHDIYGNHAETFEASYDRI